MIHINIAKQQLFLTENDQILETFPISTAKNGIGQKEGSYQTPLGLHQIYAKIGPGCPENSVFVGRQWTGEQYSQALHEQYPERDWILTRILWLNGLEYGHNRGGECDTCRRYIYIHGTPDGTAMGVPGSRGCIRMRNADIIRLFDAVSIGTHVLITRDGNKSI